MQVREIIRVKGGTLFTVAPQQSLAFAIDTMADLDVGSLVVMDGGKMVGMLTFREVLKQGNDYRKPHGGRCDGGQPGDCLP